MPLLFFAYLAFSLTRTHGHFMLPDVAVTGVAIVAYAVAGLRGGTFRLSMAPSARTLSALIVLFCLSLNRDHELIYATEAAWVAVLRSLLAIVLIAAAGRAALTWRGRSRGLLAFDVLIMALMISAQIVTLSASPSPHIDVFTMLREAMDGLLAGANPYTLTYTDIYGFNTPPPVTYFPGTFGALLPGHLVFGDFRAAYIVCTIAAVAGIYRLARDEGYDAPHARLWVLVWLTLPVSLFVLEQAWVDSLLVPLAIWSVIALRRKQWLLAGALIGYGFAIKPTVILLAWFALLLAVADGAAAALMLGGTILVVVAVVLTPFVWMEPRAFYDDTIGFLLKQPLLGSPHSLPALIQLVSNRVLPAWVGASLAALMAGLVLPWWMRRSSGLRAVAFPLALSYVVTFYVVKNAYANYYYYAAIFILADAMARQSSVRQAES
ncbi:MAG TPA: glycosyltransferase 87 family protein [Vicinamibacterales bacterium]|nr:glycosyltransferase 87 family protein [Vicinamibacterales bacterium]